MHLEIKPGTILLVCFCFKLPGRGTNLQATCLAVQIGGDRPLHLRAEPRYAEILTKRHMPLLGGRWELKNALNTFERLSATWQADKSCEYQSRVQIITHIQLSV